MSEASTQLGSDVKRSWLVTLVNVIVCVAILGTAAAAIVVINRTEPTAQQINTTRKSAALVETITVQRGSYAPSIIVLGSVEPAQDIILSPRISGQVIEVSPEFEPGGMVKQGDSLLRIDKTDFENALAIRESELEQVEASLEIEAGRQSLAKKELALLGESIDETNRALVLREPQYASIKAEVNAAKAAIERAKIDLERTQILAPFDAQVLSRSVNVGSQVATGDELGQLVGVEQCWVYAAVPIRSLRWVQLPEDGNPGSKVLLRDPNAWGEEVERPAHVTRMIGSLDEQTRLARVVITVPDPLGLKSDVPPLILDTLIEVEIQGRPIDDVVRLGREYVHEDDTVWVMKDEKLEIRSTEVAFRDAEYAYIRMGLKSGEEVVTTTLATVADGVGLRKVEDDSASEQSPSGEMTD